MARSSSALAPSFTLSTPSRLNNRRAGSTALDERGGGRLAALASANRPVNASTNAPHRLQHPLEGRSAMGTNVPLFFRSVHDQCQRLLTANPVAAPALNLKGPRTWFLS